MKFVEQLQMREDVAHHDGQRERRRMLIELEYVESIPVGDVGQMQCDCRLQHSELA